MIISGDDPVSRSAQRFEVFTISRELKKPGYVKLTARPRHHAQNEYALEALENGASLSNWQRSKTPSRKTRP